MTTRQETAVDRRSRATDTPTTPVLPTPLQSAATGALPMLRALTAPDVGGGESYGPRWIGGGHPVRETPSRRARRAEDARRLWEASERLTGVTSPV